MSNIKITQLPELAPTPLSGSDVFPVVSSNVTYQVTANAIADFVGGGGANTGNVTFDNQIVIGTGDDFGGGGLFLAQGPNSVANLQYLRVRAGDVPSHIHLDTGNTEAYDQYFGDDGKYVKLEAGYTGNVVVGTDNGNGAVTWTFSSGGVFELPGSGIITNSSIADAEITIEANAAVNLYGGATNTPGQGGGWVNVSAGNGGPDDGTNAGSGGTVNISGGDGASAISNAVGVGGGIQITGGSGGRANAANSITAGAGGMVYIYGGSAGDVDGNVDLSVNGPNVEIHGGLGSFNSGTMIGRPGDAVLQGGGNGWIGASGNVYAKTSPDGYAFYDWKFDNAGVLTLPGEGVVRSIDDTVTLQSLNTGTGNANGVYVGTSGGLGFFDQAISGNWLEIFRSVTDPQLGTPGNLLILTDSIDTPQLWTFDNTGNLTLPGNTFAVNYANGTPVSIGGGGSSNAIVNGTSNVSIASTNGNITFGLNGSNAGKIASTSLALGVNAGNGQGTNSVAIGSGAGQTTQANNTVAVGVNAGNDTQGAGAIAVGRNAGQTTQGAGAVAVGATSGFDTQGAAAVAVGQNSGQTGQAGGAIAVGYTAGSTSQNGNAIAIGYNAGSVSQGANAIAIGYNAAVGGTTPQPAGSIAIVASGVDPTPLNAGLYVDPVRNDTGNVTNAVYYNTTTKEVTYGPAGGGSSLGNLSAAGNVIFLPDSPQPASFVNYNTGTAMVLGTNSALPVSIVANYTSNAAQTWTFATSGDLSAPGNVSAAGNVIATGTDSNVVRRAFGLVAADTNVTLDDLSANVSSSTSQLCLSTSGSWQGTGWTETFAGGGTPTVNSWVNLPLPTGFTSASGAMNSQGNGCRCVISDQTPSAKVYQITAVRSGTTGALWNIAIERLV